MYAQREIYKETFKGDWPFTVSEGTLIRVGNSVLFKCVFKRIIKRSGLFAINGTAINNRKSLYAKKLPSYLRISNRNSVSDIIKYGLILK